MEVCSCLEGATGSENAAICAEFAAPWRFKVPRKPGDPERLRGLYPGQKLEGRGLRARRQGPARSAQLPRPRWLTMGWPLTESGAGPCRINSLASERCPVPFLAITGVLGVQVAQRGYRPPSIEMVCPVT